MDLLGFCLRRPLQTVCLGYTFVVEVALLTIERALLPYLPRYQSYRTRVSRAYLVSLMTHMPELFYHPPLHNMEGRAKLVTGEGSTASLVPKSQKLENFVEKTPELPKTLVMYLHGGGYVDGHPRMYLPSMERWVNRAKSVGLELAFFSVQYPLSGEKPHPAQRDAAVAAYQYLLKQNVPPERIVFMGDSAGGGLCILTTLRLLELGIPQPAATITMSPWLDMSVRLLNGGIPLVESDFGVGLNHFLPTLVSMFIGDYAGTDPEVNPLYIDPKKLRGIAPQLILVGGAEFALQDGKDWAELCKQGGVKHELIVEWGQLHTYAVGLPLMDPGVKEKTDIKIISWLHTPSARV